MKNYYKTLGISQNSSKSEIKKAFRNLAIKYHPDKHQDESLAEKFKEINEAKQVLLDDLKKFTYDSLLSHYLSELTTVGRLKNRKRRFLRRNHALVLLRESILNKYFLVVLFTVTILLTIAFLTIPSEDATIYSPVANRATRDVENTIERAQPVFNATTLPTGTKNATVTKKTVEAQVSIPVITSGYLNRKAIKYSLDGSFKKVKSTINSQRKLTAKNWKRPKRQKFIYSNKKKLLTQQQMVAILNKLQEEKLRLASNSNCVQIVKTSTSNISNAFMLAKFLKGYGYVIAGREKMEQQINGVSIDAKDCLIVTIGKM